MNKLTKEQKDNIRFAIRWSDGHKLYGVKQVRGDAWKSILQDKYDFESSLIGVSSEPKPFDL